MHLFLCLLLYVWLSCTIAVLRKKPTSRHSLRGVVKRGLLIFFFFCMRVGGKKTGECCEDTRKPHLGTFGLIHRARLLSLSVIPVVTASPIMPPSNLSISGNRFVKVKMTPIRRGCAEFLSNSCSKPNAATLQRCYSPIYTCTAAHARMDVQFNYHPLITFHVCLLFTSSRTNSVT